MLRRSLPLCLMLSLAGLPLHAQELVGRSIQTQLLQPSLGPDLSLAVERALTLAHLSHGAALLLSYQRLPFTVHTGPITSQGGAAAQGSDVALVENQLTADLLGGFGFGYRWLRGQVSLALPVHLLLSGEEIEDDGGSGDSYTTAGVGDLRLQLKIGLMREVRRVSLAVAVQVTLPTGCAGAGAGFGGDACQRDGAFRGDAGVTVSPLAIVDYRMGPLIVALNVGWLAREESPLLSTAVDDRLLYGLGVNYQLNRTFGLLGELSGQVGFAGTECRTYAGHSTVCGDPGRDTLESYPLEGLVAGDMQLPHGLSLLLGAGAGIVRGIGSPQFRVLAGLRWVPNLKDTDGDGIRDTQDACPTQAEDKDGFQDQDGCPDPDNDEDLIPDQQDRCPNQAEDKDSYQDDDGCPDPDNDSDGIPDIKDHCPFKPENKNGFKDDDGCPDEPDSDGDGIEDRGDLCPREPETLNGIEDTDGCPDADKGAIEVQPHEIVLRQRLAFDGIRIRKKYHPMLEQLGRALKVLPRLRLRVVGFSGKRRGREGLWRQRVEAVRAFLIGQGVAGGRLTVETTHKVEISPNAGHLRQGGILLLAAP